MITSPTLLRCRERWSRMLQPTTALGLLLLALFVGLTSGCAPLIPSRQQLDPAAEETVVRLKRINAELTRFKCVGRLTVAGPSQPKQSFRAAMAGQLSQQLRIDMFAPFGGAAGTVSSDGDHLFLVMHPTRKYVKKRFGRGSLRRIIQIDLTVGDLLEILVGRIPMDEGLSARMEPDANGLENHLVLVDRRNRIRQRISLDGGMLPVRSEWFDHDQRSDFSLTVDGRQKIAGFLLPQRIDLSAATGARVCMVLERYEANTQLNEGLFVPARPSS